MKYLIRSTLYIVALVLVCSSVIANGGAIIAITAGSGAAARQQAEERQQTMAIGCTPPIAFSEEHQCDLSLVDANRFSCSVRNSDVYYNLREDCHGGVIFSERLYLANIPGISIFIMVIIVGIILIYHLHVVDTT